MKKIILLLVTLFSLIELRAQCIADISYLADIDDKCFFIGSVDMEKENCFDMFANPEWQYTWTIMGADDGDFIAQYDGVTFIHSFERFGGYDFILEIDKDGNPGTPPDIVEKQTWTTCEVCSYASVEFTYNDCPVTEGCNIELKANIDAENAVGVKSLATLVMTYLPTPQEIWGGVQPYDLTFPDVFVTFHPQDKEIQISEDVTLPHARGCFQPTIILELEYGAGAHSEWGGPSCTRVEVASETIIRCLACTDDGNNCQASIVASNITNQTGTCDLFLCPVERSADFEDQPIPNSIQISPNPTRDILRLEVTQPLSNNASIFLTDSFGRVQAAGVFPHHTMEKQLNISRFSSGIYVLTVVEKGKTIHSERVAIIN